MNSYERNKEMLRASLSPKRIEELKKRPFAKIFPMSITHMELGNCWSCKKKITAFKDDISRKEFTISGLCQECQDGVFGKD